MQTPSHCISSHRLSKNVHQATPISITACPVFSHGNIRRATRAIAWLKVNYQRLTPAHRTWRQEGIPPAMNIDEAAQYGIADGIQAIKVVRQHAAEWCISPDRVGFLGFSAGAVVTSGVLLQEDAAGRPNFAALIYGSPFGVMPAIPAKLPPMFSRGRRTMP